MSLNDHGKREVFAISGTGAAGSGMLDGVAVAEIAREMLLGDATMSSLTTANLDGRRVLKLLADAEPVVSSRLEDAKVGGERGARVPGQTGEEKKTGTATTCRTIFSTKRDIPKMKKIIVEYVEGLGEEVAKLLNFMNQRDLQPLRRVAHQLRGSGGGYGFDAISELAGRVEDSIAAGDTLAAIRIRVLHLVDTVCRVEGYNDNDA